LINSTKFFKNSKWLEEIFNKPRRSCLVKKNTSDKNSYATVPLTSLLSDAYRYLTKTA